MGKEDDAKVRVGDYATTKDGTRSGRVVDVYDRDGEGMVEIKGLVATTHSERNVRKSSGWI